MKKLIMFLTKFIIYIIVVIVATASYIFGFLWLQLKLSNPKNYIMFLSPDINLKIVTFIGLPITILFAQKILNSKLLKDKPHSQNEEVLDDKLNLNFFDFIKVKRKVVYSLLIIFCCVISAYALTNYCVIYENSIKIHSLFHPMGKSYQWSDVKDVRVGIKEYKRKQYDFYYIIELTGNSTINLNQSHEVGDREIRDVLLEIDDKIKAKNIVKIIDKTNLEKYGHGLDNIYIEKTRQLFND